MIIITHQDIVQNYQQILALVGKEKATKKRAQFERTALKTAIKQWYILDGMTMFQDEQTYACHRVKNKKLFHKEILPKQWSHDILTEVFHEMHQGIM